MRLRDHRLIFTAMKTWLFFVTLWLCSSVRAQDMERVAYIDSLLEAHKFKPLKSTTARDEQKVIVGYAKAAREDRLWCVTEQQLTSDGFETPKTTRYYFWQNDLLAIVVYPRYKDCRKCRCLYYFTGNRLVHKEEETHPQEVEELLAAARKYSFKAPLLPSK